MKPIENNAGTSLISVSTLVLWMMCLSVGVLGFALPYPEIPVPPKPVPPVKATLLSVELTTEPVLPQSEPTLPKLSEPPPLLPPVTEPAAPPMVAVAEPNPAIAFALPVEGPARVVDAKQADFKRPVAPAAPAATPKPQPLVFGQGEGKQPAPEYPPKAQHEGQEGTVVIRFSVDVAGRVTAADISARSPWPLLNQSALQVVRNRWRFQPGPLRLYEVPIKFELEK